MKFCDLLAQRAVYMERKISYSTMKTLDDGTTFRWVYMQKFGSMWCPSRVEEIRDDGRQKQNCNLGPSALFTGVNNCISAELSQ